ncbi:type I restriction enzyme, S subunit [Thermoanaerobacter thermohydrosulfuricus]|uniref:Type I restriction enzyme, S subunit n=1 Tax=Thermoanaerobacter thermohydrosulfuricus TaxID=1516 RepID=A0A1G7S8H2_THETY|nr:restriction endonuclease subunit S [Thermoanaerobacter thermohydrosulfuricus]SDG19281.1 type I restriction enzyme, S subunit [Thermoanaerobacter thermohydrosulfuricus]
MGSEWKKVKLEQIAVFKNGKKIDENERKANGKYYIYGSNGIIGKTDKFLVSNDCIIIGRVGAYCGSLQYSKDPSWVTDNAIFCLTNKDTDLKFLFYVLKTIPIRDMAGGSAQPLINQEILNNITITCPPLTEQQKIASILSTFDDKIELNNEMNKTLEEIAQAIFKHWFIDFEFPNENGEPYKSSGGEFVDSELGPIPKEWEVKKLGEIGQFKNGINYGREESGDSEYKIVNVRDLVTTDYIVPSRLDTINIDKRKANQYLLKEGDLLIVRSANPGEIGINMNSDSNLIYSSFIIRFRLYDKLQLFYLYFSLKNIKQKLEIYSNGTTLKNINQQILKEVKVMIPTKNILQKFNVIISPIIEKIIASNEQNEKLAKIRDTLLPKLISGEIRVM